MHRVELKEQFTTLHKRPDTWFLMHRVELKDLSSSPGILGGFVPVPNAPCGVESLAYWHFSHFSSAFLMHRVELKGMVWGDGSTWVWKTFLMHRVELKADYTISVLLDKNVPNAPCGVESFQKTGWGNLFRGFLMHRVELKASRASSWGAQRLQFLMHRVELKVWWAQLIWTLSLRS